MQHDPHKLSWNPLKLLLAKFGCLVGIGLLAGVAALIIQGIMLLFGKSDVDARADAYRVGETIALALFVGTLVFGAGILIRDAVKARRDRCKPPPLPRRPPPLPETAPPATSTEDLRIR